MAKHKLPMTTLVYLEKDGKYLMLHRTRKEKDVNKDKWIGVGGHFEEGESPEECAIREVKEETGYEMTDYRLRSVITFSSPKQETEYMFLYTATGWTGEEIACSEGELVWIPIEEVPRLNTWEGDLIFLQYLREGRDFFTMKLIYDAEDRLIRATVDGKVIKDHKAD